MINTTLWKKGEKSGWWLKHTESWLKGKLKEDSPNWKGGQTKINGYIIVYCPNRPNHQVNKSYVKRCVLVAEKKLGRYLNPKEVIHHINHIRDDDRPENLYLFLNKDEHSKFRCLKNEFKLVSNLI